MSAELTVGRSCNKSIGPERGAAASAAFPNEKTKRETASMATGTVRLRAIAAAGTASAAARWTGLAEIQLHRRQQRSRPGAGRRPDRRRQCRAQARGQDARRPTASPAARRAIVPLREFLVAQAQARRRHRLHRRRHPDRLRLAAGARPGQRRAAGARRYRHHRAGQLSGLAEPADPARRQRRSAFRSTATACGWTRWQRA